MKSLGMIITLIIGAWFLTQSAGEIVSILVALFAVGLIGFGLWLGIRWLAKEATQAQAKTIVAVIVALFVLQLFLASVLNPATLGFSNEWITEGQRLATGWFSAAIIRIVTCVFAWVIWYTTLPILGWQLYQKKWGEA